jgi:hypothetical protein
MMTCKHVCLFYFGLLIFFFAVLSTPDTYGTLLGIRTSVASLARGISPLVNGQLFDLPLKVREVVKFSSLVFFDLFFLSVAGWKQSSLCPVHFVCWLVVVDISSHSDR